MSAVWVLEYKDESNRWRVYNVGYDNKQEARAAAERWNNADPLTAYRATKYVPEKR